MLPFRDFWTRHKRKVFVTVGVLGSGYALYKLYAARTQRLFDLQRELEEERITDELIKAQQQAHFENIQRIAESTTLPYAMQNLQYRISEELDLSHLTERLMQGKGQPNTLTPLEKLELWERLKILSFTKLVSSLWAMTALNLYIRVQVNILGRHLYLDTARDLGSSYLQDEADPFDMHGQQEFLATADYLANYGTGTLIPNMKTATTEVLKEKNLRDPFNASALRESIKQILDTFMSVGGRNHWVTYVVPENAITVEHLTAMTLNYTAPVQDTSKLEQLMIETCTVLSSVEFGSVMEISLRSAVDALIDDIEMQTQGKLSSGIALAKLLPRVAQMGPVLLQDPSSNQFIDIIRSLQEVELFYSLLYANMPIVP